MADDTTTLLVHGLNGEGPGDINDGTATVDVQAGVADRIVQILDGSRVGNSTVSIAPLDEKTESARAYADRLTDLVELEREEEMRRHEREIKNLSGGNARTEAAPGERQWLWATPTPCPKATCSTGSSGTPELRVV